MATKLFKQNVILSIIALIAGIQLPLTFAPFNVYVAAIISPALLLATWVYTPPKQALLRGFLYGLGGFAAGLYWIYISVHTYGNAPLPLAFLLTGLLIAVLALFPAAQGYLLVRFFSRNNLSKFLLAFPASWVLFEWIRSWFLTGFPWLLLGYSQMSSPLRGFAPLVSVYGVSFLVALTAGAIVVPFVLRRLKPIIVTLLLIIIIWITGFWLTHQQWTQPQGKPVSVALMQGNIPQEMKWQPNATHRILADYEHLTKRYWPNDLVIWPEAAIPIFDWQAEHFLNIIQQKAKQNHATIILGIPIEDLKTSKYYNGMLALGLNNSRYLKRHLVPFGEYPFLSIISEPFMKFFKIPMSGFTPGPKHQPPFIAANMTIAPSICYEIAYPYEILHYLPKAQLLVNITDDSWFGHSIAAAQQLEIAQMRALETGRYLLAATNTGITAIIGPNGRVLNQAPIFQSMTLTGTVYAMTGATPWVSFGYYMWLIITLLCLIAAVWRQYHIKK